MNRLRPSGLHYIPIDASGQPETSFLYGNNLWIGSHTHCSDISNEKPLEINHEKVTHSTTDFDFPPYAMKFVKVFLKHNSTLQLHVRLPLDFTIQLGLCVPRSCSNHDIFQLIELYLTGKYLNFQQIYNIDLKVERVKTIEESAMFMLSLPKTMILLIIFGITALLSIAGTTHDVKKHHRDKKFASVFPQHMIGNINGKSGGVELVRIPQDPIEKEGSLLWEILKCFSVYSNVKALVNTNIGEGSVRCVHGIKFFGMLWVILIHSLYFKADFTSDPPYAFRISETFLLQIMTNSTYSVDTYLFLSGFLIAYLFYKSKKLNEQNVNYSRKISEFLIMCFHRFVRLTPAYFIVILLCDVVFTYIRRTSSLEISENLDELCSKYWWRNVLYLNNLFPRSEMCLSWSWYLSLDTQCFMIAAFLLIVSTFAFKAASFTLLFMILGSVMVTTYKSYSIGYIPTMDEQLARLDDIYDLPWNRIGPYLVGMATAYLLVVKLKFQLSLGKVTKAILWTVFPLLNLWILFTLYTRQLSVEFSAIYMGVSRTLWGIGIAWTLTACSTGNAEMINKFLSYPGWIPLSRLTYCAYLLNPLVTTTYAITENAYGSSTFGGYFSAMGIATITFLYSFFISIFFESPFILLTKILMRRLLKSDSTKEIAKLPNNSK
ncbi:hypothetical protein HHI36_016605 [Cryptolaemus montrouzieri]|uniref:Nose resistant to fluoxetine protein 6 n=1 Tax=Cryptolaemus montrouzieri TaxID=559131 RepID=A0ABD2NK01_9CUCU